MEWQPIETAPKDGTAVLACEYGYPSAYVAEYVSANRTWISESRISFVYPDCWMPLPAPPSKAKGE